MTHDYKAALENDLDDWIKAPAAKDYDGLLVQFRAMKSLLNSQGQRLSWYSNKDYSLSEKKLKGLELSIDSEKQMNFILTQEAEQLRKERDELARTIIKIHEDQEGDYEFLKFISYPQYILAKKVSAENGNA